MKPMQAIMLHDVSSEFLFDTGASVSVKVESRS